MIELPIEVKDTEMNCPRCGAVIVLYPSVAVQEPSQWAVGMRILTPWEPQWLYPATIEALSDTIALVAFDDGDRAERNVSDLYPIRIEEGDRVFARRDKSQLSYSPAAVMSVNQETLSILYTDDGVGEETTVSFVRILRTDANVPSG